MRFLKILKGMESRRPPLEQSCTRSLWECQQAAPKGWVFFQAPLMRQVWNQNHTPGEHFQSPSPVLPCPPASFLTPANSLSSRRKEGQVAADWKTAIYLLLQKVFLENEHSLRFEFSTNENMVSLFKSLLSISLTYTHSLRVIQKKTQTLHAPGTVKWPKYYKN